MRCPGQDRGYWKPDAVFEVPCPQCGKAVELFKDETSRRCPNCGHTFRNPGADFGCAKWCSLAEQCLGLAPDREVAVESAGGALAGRLIQLLARTLEGDATRMTRALKVFHYARQLVSVEGGDPRIVLAAALLLDTQSTVPAADGEHATGGLSGARAILRESGADQETIDRVCEIIDWHRAGENVDSTELRVVHDADILAGLTARGSGTYRPIPGEPELTVQNRLATESAREWIRRWRQASAGQSPHRQGE